MLVCVFIVLCGCLHLAGLLGFVVIVGLVWLLIFRSWFCLLITDGGLYFSCRCGRLFSGLVDLLLFLRDLGLLTFDTRGYHVGGYLALYVFWVCILLFVPWGGTVLGVFLV